MNNLLPKKIIIFLTITLLFLGSACSNSLTKKLWNDNFYNEIFYHFLISKDGQFVVFLNDQYHYVFNDNSGIIKKLLLWRNSKKLYINTEETILKISPNNQVQGIVKIDIDKSNISPADFTIINSLGFIANQETYSLEFKVFGQRYQANKSVTNRLPRLSTQYNITIYRDLSTTQKITKASLSPLTIVLDAIMISGKILTFPFNN
jgi:hypothetical protein